MNTTKWVCIKEGKGFSFGTITIEEGQIVDIVDDEFFRGSLGQLDKDIKSIIFYIKGDLIIFDVKEFPEHFIPLSEWREKQINSIFEDDRDI